MPHTTDRAPGIEPALQFKVCPTGTQWVSGRTYGTVAARRRTKAGSDYGDSSRRRGVRAAATKLYGREAFFNGPAELSGEQSNMWLALGCGE